MVETPIKKKYLVSAFIFALIGFGISWYMLSHTIEIQYGIRETPSFCSISSFIDCDAASASSYSHTFGIPNAAFGMALYGLLIFLILTGILYNTLYLWLQTTFAFILVSLALLSSVYLAFISVFVIKTLCILCVADYCVNLVLFILLKKSLNTGIISSIKESYRITRELLQSRENGNLAYLFHTKLTGLLIIIACLAAPSIKKAHLLDENMALMYQKYIEYYENQNPVSIDIQNSPVWGNKQAKVTLVEFADYECPACRASFIPIKMVLPQYRDTIQFVFKHFPLSYHEKAYPASHASLCAQEQGKFWEYHAKLFQGELSLHEFENYAHQLNLNMDNFKTCMASNKFKSTIEKDIAQGSTIGVQGTPTLYLNGKQIKGKITVQFLNQLLAKIINETPK